MNQEEINNLKERCKEILDWHDTGYLSGNALVNYAREKYPLSNNKLILAEAETAREAFRFIVSL